METRIFARICALLVIVALALITPLSAVASPGITGKPARTAAQNVDYLSAGQASSLALGFTVLVPSWVPAPFGGSPAISGGGGYYSLYWMIPGGDPTFLQVKGEAGGSLPAGSPADLNNELSINASVQGYDAIHDVTDIYDTVWWVANGVLYEVSSKNMTGTDSLSLANSLIALQAPVAPEPTPVPTLESTPIPTLEPTPVPTLEPTPEPTSPSVVETPAATGEPETGNEGGTAPDSQDDTSSSLPSQPESQESTTGNVTSPGSQSDSTATDDSPQGGTSPTEPSGAASGTGPDATNRTPAPASVQSPGSSTDNDGVLSDGTAGPVIPNMGDGTGGALEFTLP